MRRIGTGSQKVLFLAAGSARNDEPGVLEHAQVLHDTEPSHRQLRSELGGVRPSRTKQPIEQVPGVWSRRAP